MKFAKYTLPFIAGFFLFTATVMAQGGQQQQQQLPDAEDITDAELERFVNATDTIQVLQRDAQKQVQSLVKEEGMDFKRFRMIMMSRRNPQMAQQVQVTEEEQKTIKKIEPKLKEINQNTRKKVMGAIQSEGLTPQRFQQIFKVAQSDSSFADRLRQVQGDMNDGEG